MLLSIDGWVGRVLWLLIAIKGLRVEKPVVTIGFSRNQFTCEERKSHGTRDGNPRFDPGVRENRDCFAALAMTWPRVMRSL